MLAVGPVQADVFNMPAGQTSLQFVTVGDPGNAARHRATTATARCRYTYQMGKYDVTVGQYCQFLNAVAKTDTYGLYNSYMADRTIRRSPSPRAAVQAATATRSLAVTAGRQLSDIRCHLGRCGPLLQLAAKRPADRGKGGTTETGAYTLNGATTQTALMAITRNAGATYFIPSENEWYKAAYYKGRDQRRLLALPHAEQHRAEQRAFRDRHEQRQLFTATRLHRSDELPDAGGGVCGIARALWHV